MATRYGRPTLSVPAAALIAALGTLVSCFAIALAIKVVLNVG